MNAEARSPVLILTADTGSGHRSVSRAIAESAASQPEAGIDVIELDPLASRDPLWRTSGRQARPEWGDVVVGMYGTVVVNAPWLWGMSYRAAKSPGTLATYGATYGHAVQQRIRDAIEVTAPAAVVSVHPLVNHAMATARHGHFTTTGIRLPLMTIVTDLVDVHPWWVSQDVDQIIVSTPGAVESVAGRGIDRHRIVLNGQPIREEFDLPQPTARDMRARLNLDPEAPMVMFMGGGDGAGRMIEVIDACHAELRGAGRPAVQFVAICGRNERAISVIAARGWDMPVVALGHVTNVHEWMVAADVVVTKPGPSTITEAMALGRPLLVGPPLPGQEEGNVPYVCQTGAGRSYRTPTEGARTLRLMLDDPDGLEVMARNGRASYRPGATRALVGLVARLARTPADGATADPVAVLPVPA